MRVHVLVAFVAMFFVAVPDADGPYPDSFVYTTAIAHEPGVVRRDPSDVIRVDDTYYVWYSKVVEQPGAPRTVGGIPSGYAADLYYATSPDGRTWTEQGMAVGKGGSGAWDEHGAFTPNILVAQGKYYLFYTGVPMPFDRDTKTAIGLAVSDSPDGPWRKAKGNPILLPSEDPDNFDSMRVDDAALIVRDGNYWLYYKGRQLGRTPNQTMMGVAIAPHPEGPYTKHEAGALHRGHEVMVWPQGDGVASMATAAGPRIIYYAEDGINFESKQNVTHTPTAPGIYRADAFQSPPTATPPIRWGISHRNHEGYVHLVRFDCVYSQEQ